jgi:hypothetical protein
LSHILFDVIGRPAEIVRVYTGYEWRIEGESVFIEEVCDPFEKCVSF